MFCSYPIYSPSAQVLTHIAFSPLGGALTSSFGCDQIHHWKQKVDLNNSIITKVSGQHLVIHPYIILSSGFSVWYICYYSRNRGSAGGWWLCASLPEAPLLWTKLCHVIHWVATVAQTYHSVHWAALTCSSSLPKHDHISAAFTHWTQSSYSSRIGLLFLFFIFCCTCEVSSRDVMELIRVRSRSLRERLLTDEQKRTSRQRSSSWRWVWRADEL